MTESASSAAQRCNTCHQYLEMNQDGDPCHTKGQAVGELKEERRQRTGLKVQISKWIICDRYGWPVERIRGRWFTNLIRLCLYGRRLRRWTGVGVMES